MATEYKNNDTYNAHTRGHSRTHKNIVFFFIVPRFFINECAVFYSLTMFCQCKGSLAIDVTGSHLVRNFVLYN